MLIRERTDRIEVEIVVSQGVKLACHEISIGKLFLGVATQFFRPVGVITFHFRTDGKLIFIHRNLNAVLVHDCPNHALFAAVEKQHEVVPLVGTASGFLEPCLDHLGETFEVQRMRSEQFLNLLLFFFLIHYVLPL